MIGHPFPRLLATKLRDTLFEQFGKSGNERCNHPVDRSNLAAALWTAAEKRDKSVENILTGPKVIALVVTETGKEFNSMPFLRKLWRKIRQIKREMDGLPAVEGDEA
jgi:hypothetical protein